MFDVPAVSFCSLAPGVSKQKQKQQWAGFPMAPPPIDCSEVETHDQVSSCKLLLGGCETLHVLRRKPENSIRTSESTTDTGQDRPTEPNKIQQVSPGRSRPGLAASSPQTGFPPQRTETPGSPSGWTEGWRTTPDSSPPDGGPSDGGTWRPLLTAGRSGGSG